jgi:hypothetical protein
MSIDEATAFLAEAMGMIAFIKFLGYALGKEVYFS